MNTWLDVAIGVSFTFALFSAVCSSIHELLAWATELRARTLRSEFGRLLGDPHVAALFGDPPDRGLSRELLAHPVVTNLYRSTFTLASVGPSYIPTTTFGSAMLDLLVGQDVVGSVPALVVALTRPAAVGGALGVTLVRVVGLEAPLDTDAAKLAEAAGNGGERRAVRAAVDKLPGSLLRACVLALIEEEASDAHRSRHALRLVRFLSRRPVAARARDAVAAMGASPARDVTLALLDAASVQTRREAAAQVEAMVALGGVEVESLMALVRDLPPGRVRDALTVAVGGVSDAQRTVARLDLERLAVSDPLGGLRQAIELMGEDSTTGRVLSATIDRTTASLEEARAKLERWFDDGMSHCSAIYRRRSQVVLGCIAVVLVAAANFDAVRVTRALVNDAVLRETVVRVAQVQRPAEGAAGSAAPKLEDTLRAAARTRQEIADLPLPIGWSSDPLRLAPNAPGYRAPTPGNVAEKVLGLILSALALLTGAPFWFSLVNQLVSLRAVGRPPPPAGARSGAPS